MLTYNKDDFDGTLDDIMETVNKILNKTDEESKNDDLEENSATNKK